MIRHQRQRKLFAASVYNRRNVYYILIQGIDKMEKITPFEKHGFGAKPFNWLKEARLNDLKVRGNGKSIFGLGRHPLISIVNEPIQTHLRGGSMDIIFDRYENTKTKPNASGKSFNMIRVFGEAKTGKLAGQEYTTQFFANNQELKDQVENLNKGDLVEITMAKAKSGYFNPTGFIRKAGPAPKMESGTVGSALMGVPASNQRFDNLKVAVDIMGTKATDQECFEYLQEAAGVADMIQDYLEKKGAFQFDEATSDGIPDDENEDWLETE